MKLVGLTESPACAPVPESEIVAGEPVALLVTVTLPFALPAVVGLNTTPNVNVCDGVSVAGTLTPLRVYPVPLTVIDETRTFVLPVFVIVTFLVDDVPVFTFPNARLDELNESVCVAATPVPLSATVAGEFDALLAMLTVPTRFPAVVGAKTALNVAVAPTAIDVELRPLTE